MIDTKEVGIIVGVKMGVLQFLLILVNVAVCKIAAQPEGSDCAYVLGLLEDEEDADRFFQVLRDFESEGDLCKINGTNYKIGPYQISKEYYDVAVAFNENLRQGQLYVQGVVTPIRPVDPSATGIKMKSRC